MDSKLLNRVVALGVFLYALIIYTLTVAPDASFWDAGEFIAISNRLQVSHPPGAPFYMLLGRVFSMFVPAASVAFAVNMMSVLASALTILLTHLIIVSLVRDFQSEEERSSGLGRFGALAGGVLGACTFAVTDSFWFNAVESEVYALSMFFTALVTWLILEWMEAYRVEQKGHRVTNRYHIGKTTARYLVIIAYCFGLATGVHLLNLLVMFFIALIVFFEKFDRPDWSPMQRIGGLAVTAVVSSLAFFAIYPGIVTALPSLALSIGSLTLTLAVLIALVVGLIYYSQVNNRQVLNVVAVCFAVFLIGYSTYAVIFIRSAADPPIDENDPENLESIVSYLKREQYGSSTPIMDRRHSTLPQHQAAYNKYSSDGDFFWTYQVNHMYVRYFMWNFVGRASDTQDAPWITGIRPVSNPERWESRTPSERAARNRYFAIPLLLGLIGMFYHFRKDWRKAMAVGVLFISTGIAIVLYLNQTEPQPRERDYSYVASFFAFSLWVGIGGAGLVEMAGNLGRKEGEPGNAMMAYGIAAVAFLAVPAWMLVENYDDHDRSGRKVAEEYAYNLLNSLEPNAILFTNGDNDTFPLWYLQEVERVRTDVRVVCLSLLQTPWYINQMKNQSSRESAPIAMTLSDDQIKNIEIVPTKAGGQELTLPVDKASMLRDGQLLVPGDDFDRMESPMRWTVQGRPYNNEFNLLYVSDQAVLSILSANAQEGWKRPVYFANTTSPDGQMNLQNYFQTEGLAYRVVPIRHNTTGGRVIPDIALERLKNFKFTNLNDPDVYLDSNIRNMMDNYRLTFAHAAEAMVNQGRQGEAIELLDDLNEKMPVDIVSAKPSSQLLMARAYGLAGAKDKANALTKKLESMVVHDFRDAWNSGQDSRIRTAYDFLNYTQGLYAENSDFESVARMSQIMADITGDPNQARTADQIRAQYQMEVQQVEAPADSMP